MIKDCLLYSYPDFLIYILFLIKDIWSIVLCHPFIPKDTPLGEKQLLVHQVCGELSWY